MDLQKITLRSTVERIIKKGGNPDPKDLAELLRENDLSPLIGEHIADYYVMKSKQKLVGRKPDSALDRLSEQARVWALVLEIMDRASESGRPITRAQAIDLLAERKLPNLSRSKIYAILK